LLLITVLLVLPAPLQSQNQAAFTSDDFSAVELNTDLWQIINPLGDAAIGITGPYSVDASLGIYVPAGSPHDLWGALRDAPRIMQAAQDTDFGLEVRFNSAVSSQFQMQGIIIEQDSNSYLRFDFYSDGTATYIFAAHFQDEQAVSAINHIISPIG